MATNSHINVITDMSYRILLNKYSSLSNMHATQQVRRCDHASIRSGGTTPKMRHAYEDALHLRNTSSPESSLSSKHDDDQH